VLAVAGFTATRLRLLDVVSSAGFSVSLVAAAARFAVPPHDDGCRWWLSAVDATRFEVVLELRVLQASTLDDAATTVTDAAAVVLAVVVVAGRFLGTSKSRRGVCLLLLRVRLQTDWIGFVMMAFWWLILCE